MNVCVVGLGHVGLVTAACLARAGHAVVGVDQERSRVECVSAGGSPVPETGLAEMIAEAVGAGRLSVTADLAAAVASTEVTLVCVGTPADPGGSLDYAALEAVCRTIGVAIAEAARFHVVVIRSTVLPGALEGVVEPALAGGRTRCAVAANPEFLREGHAIADFIDPPFVLAGTDDDRAAEVLTRLYEPLGLAVTRVTPDEAALVKLASNAFHATKVAFANEIGALCADLGIDGQRVMEVFRRDDRLNTSGAYLRPGFAFGGPCLPKDLGALVRLGEDAGSGLALLPAVSASNDRAINRAMEQVLALGVTRVGLVGLAFKVGTAELRGSPLVALARRLSAAGLSVSAFDPAVTALPEAPGVTIYRSVDELVTWSEALAIGRADLVGLVAVTDGRPLIDLAAADPS